MTHNINLNGAALRELRERKAYADRGLADVYDQLATLKDAVTKMSKQIGNISEALTQVTEDMEDTTRWRRDVNAVFDKSDWTQVDA